MTTVCNIDQIQCFVLLYCKASITSGSQSTIMMVFQALPGRIMCTSSVSRIIIVKSAFWTSWGEAFFAKKMTC